MSRLLCLIMLSLGLVQIAAADENDHDRISDYLTQKFGVARAKATQIKTGVRRNARFGKMTLTGDQGLKPRLSQSPKPRTKPSPSRSPKPRRS